MDSQRTFEEWMKIAADNKITASNTWNLALIDYFHDMSFLKDGDAINFQKASCTLDGCIKIYMYRVDSVDTETKQLLSGLADRGGASGDSEEGADESQAKEQTSKRKVTRTCETLEKDFASLNVKRFETEFMVDPLFKKTSADFDEGSASGLLLNHLSMSQTGKIIFDASDAEVGTLDAETEASAPPQKINIQSFRDKFMPSLNKIWTCEVCPSLSKFSFNGDIPDIEMFTRGSEEPSESQVDFNDDMDNASNHDDPFFNDGMENDDDEEDGTPPPAEEAPYYDRRASMADGGGMLEMTNGDDSAFSYFDTALIRSWAGPGYWKPIRPKITKAASEKPKTRKERVKVDLFAQQVTEKELFATSSASLKLPKSSERATMKNLLPDDEHFSSADFFRLFLQPTRKPIFRSKNGTSLDPNKQTVSTDEFSIEINPSQLTVPDDGDDDDAYIKNLHLMLGGFRHVRFSYGDQLVDAPKKIKASFIHYARAPKRVDVKRLKENLWTNIRPSQTPQPTPLQNKFTDVVSTLNTRYEEKDLKDISVAFCFICLLHLANERNLSIKGDVDLIDLTISVPGE
ncbi:condensin complex subunit 2/barren [Chytridium lagenaria]|nr:condensin complex subunit 2/barren [Chytridium lagenaria]